MKKVSMYVNQHGQNIKCVHPVKAQAMMDHITTRAAEKGMVVNGSKTTLMCINAATSYKTSAKLTDQSGGVIESVNKANYLGVTIDSDCSLTSHVQNIRSKMRARTWALIKLRQSGFSEKELVQIYCSYVRPIAEYAAVSWTHSSRVNRRQYWKSNKPKR